MDEEQFEELFFYFFTIFMDEDKKKKEKKRITWVCDIFLAVFMLLNHKQPSGILSYHLQVLFFTTYKFQNFKK